MYGPGAPPAGAPPEALAFVQVFRTAVGRANRAELREIALSGQVEALAIVAAASAGLYVSVANSLATYAQRSARDGAGSRPALSALVNCGVLDIEPDGPQGKASRARLREAVGQLQRGMYVHLLRTGGARVSERGEVARRDRVVSFVFFDACVSVTMPTFHVFTIGPELDPALCPGTVRAGMTAADTEGMDGPCVDGCATALCQLGLDLTRTWVRWLGEPSRPPLQSATALAADVHAVGAPPCCRGSTVSGSPLAALSRVALHSANPTGSLREAVAVEAVVRLAEAEDRPLEGLPAHPILSAYARRSIERYIDTGRCGHYAARAVTAVLTLLAGRGEAGGRACLDSGLFDACARLAASVVGAGALALGPEPALWGIVGACASAARSGAPVPGSSLPAAVQLLDALRPFPAPGIPNVCVEDSGLLLLEALDAYGYKEFVDRAGADEGAHGALHLIDDLVSAVADEPIGLGRLAPDVEAKVSKWGHEGACECSRARARGLARARPRRG